MAHALTAQEALVGSEKISMDIANGKCLFLVWENIHS